MPRSFFPRADEGNPLRRTGWHDFGKVGVREEVLVKAKKLYPVQIDLIAHRFDYLYMEMEARMEREKFRILLEMDRPEALARIAALEEEYRLRRAQMESGFQVILQSNEPTVLPEGKFERLAEIAREDLSRSARNRETHSSRRKRFVSFPFPRKPQLGERAQIESHVIHSFNFLLQIPWTKQNPRDSANRARAPREIEWHRVSLQIAQR